MVPSAPVRVTTHTRKLSPTAKCRLSKGLASQSRSSCFIHCGSTWVGGGGERKRRERDRQTQRRHKHSHPATHPLFTFWMRKLAFPRRYSLPKCFSTRLLAAPPPPALLLLILPLPPPPPPPLPPFPSLPLRSAPRNRFIRPKTLPLLPTGLALARQARSTRPKKEEDFGVAPPCTLRRKEEAVAAGLLLLVVARAWVVVVVVVEEEEAAAGGAAWRRAKRLEATTTRRRTSGGRQGALRLLRICAMPVDRVWGKGCVRG